MGGLANQAITFAGATKLAGPSGAKVVCDLTYLNAYKDAGCGITPRQFELNTLLRFPAETVDGVPGHVTMLPWEADSIPDDDKDYCVSGYFQRLAALPSYDDLRTMFTPAESPNSANESWNFIQKLGAEPIGIHVRRGDYITQPNAFAFHGVMGVDYYKEAISLLKAQNGGLVGNGQLVVYSDDVPWCKEHLVPELGFDDVLYAEDYISDTATELYSMAYLPYFAIANSSFSWLGRLRAVAYGHNSTVYPKNWFTSGLPEGMMVPEWQGI